MIGRCEAEEEGELGVPWLGGDVVGDVRSGGRREEGGEGFGDEVPGEGWVCSVGEGEAVGDVVEFLAGGILSAMSVHRAFWGAKREVWRMAGRMEGKKMHTRLSEPLISLLLPC